jgi:L-fuconolactonase
MLVGPSSIKELRNALNFMKLNRRQFIQAGAAAGALAVAGIPVEAASSKLQIIDCHTHFYDPTRAKGVPWPPREEARLYRRVMPKDLQRVSAKLGVVGAVVVEASEWIEDNQWILDLAANEPFIVGFVGNVPLAHPEFQPLIKRFARNPVFRGIRVRGAAAAKIAEPESIQQLQFLAYHDLSLDYNCLPEQLPLIAQVAKEVPNLRIIVNHVANVTINGKAPPEAWLAGMAAAAKNPNVFLKVSGLVEGSRRDDARAPRDVEYYRPVLDAVTECFGVERLIYGSNWPVSELFAPYDAVLHLIRQYFGGKSWQWEAKVCCENSQTAYKWVRRK